MIAIDAKELWRQIPPEEKLELMSTAHGKGFLSATVTIIVMGTLAIALQQQMLLWGSLVLAPLVFQLAAFKAWRMLRPKLMLEHLAARSAARRYAFSHRAQDLGVVTVFRGKVEQTLEGEGAEQAVEALEQAVVHNEDGATWIALFNDCIVALSERRGGARLRVAHLINKKLSLQSGDEAGKEYKNDREVVLKFTDDDLQRTVRISSRYPAALIVFEKKLQSLWNAALNKDEAPVDLPADESEEMFNQMGDNG